MFRPYRAGDFSVSVDLGLRAPPQAVTYHGLSAGRIGGPMSVAERRLRIARRFNAGSGDTIGKSPAGTTEPHFLNRPFGTLRERHGNPALKRRAIVECPSGTHQPQRGCSVQPSGCDARRYPGITRGTS